MNTKPRNENELARLKDDELIAHAVAARDVGDQASFEAAVKQFVAGRMGIVEFWVSKKASGHEKDEIVGDALVSIIKGAGRIKGSSPGEVVEWMRTVTQRRIADYYRAMEKDPGSVPIDEQPGEDDEWGPVLGTPDSTGAVEVNLVIEQVLQSRNGIKKEVVRLRRSGFTAKETAAMCGDDKMTSANVDAIFSRFRKDLDAALGSN